MKILPVTDQTIWVVEFAPIPPHSSGGFDWYFRYDDAFKRFQCHHDENNILCSHQIGIYSVHLPQDWTFNQIQAWTEDSYNVLPCHSTAPATAGDTQ